MQGGEHATLLPESNLRFAVRASHPLHDARPCERKEGLDTFFSSKDKHNERFLLVFHPCAAKRKLRPSQANIQVSTVKISQTVGLYVSLSALGEQNLYFDIYAQVRAERSYELKEVWKRQSEAATRRPQCGCHLA